ncbi:alanine racemase [candidate division KSB1 bacterium]|nr:alanine racemase [candidate division KSB1 bacterium]
MRPTFAEIDLSAIAFNIKGIKKRVHPAQVMAVVKADGYGHGAIQVARVAIENGASYLGVALVEEGIQLRQQGIQEPILVFGGAFEEQLKSFFDYNLEITVYKEDTANKLAEIAHELQKPIDVHIKVDTGMGRVGIPYEKSVSFIEFVNNLEGVSLKGLYTHFATSDEKDKQYANLQLDRFMIIISQLEKKSIHVPLKHAANSGAILDLPETYLDMVRPGVMMYGFYPSVETTESVAIKAAMTFKSRVSYIKQVPDNTSVSYGRKFITSRPTRLATLPVGYADGYNRLLSNKGIVTIRGNKFPVIGRVCMDLIVVDLGDDKTIQEGDEVILFGREEDNAFTVKEICNMLNTIPYEVTCWVSKRVPRKYLFV